MMKEEEIDWNSLTTFEAMMNLRKELLIDEIIRLKKAQQQKAKEIFEDIEKIYPSDCEVGSLSQIKKKHLEK